MERQQRYSFLLCINKEINNQCPPAGFNLCHSSYHCIAGAGKSAIPIPSPKAYSIVSTSSVRTAIPPIGRPSTVAAPCAIAISVLANFRILWIARPYTVGRADSSIVVSAGPAMFIPNCSRSIAIDLTNLFISSRDIAYRESSPSVKVN